MTEYIAVWKPDAYHEVYEIFEDKLSLREFSAKINRHIEMADEFGTSKPDHIRIFAIKDEVTGDYIR